MEEGEEKKEIKEERGKYLRKNKIDQDKDIGGKDGKPKDDEKMGRKRPEEKESRVIG